MSAPAAPPAHPGTAARLPDFFVVGHEKSGTTALYGMLRNHPQVYLPELKEPRFFSPEVRGASGAREDLPYTATLEEYLALFASARPEQLVGETSPQYLRSPGAARAIAELCPDARIIAILREPVDFLRSFHLQCVQAGRETHKDLRKALELEPARREGKRLPRGYSSPAWLLYSEHVRYVEQLRRFHAAFPRERVLVLIYDDYVRDNQSALRAVQRFLEIDDTLPVDAVHAMQTRSTARFTTLHPLSRRLRLAWHRPEDADPLTRTLAALAPRSARRLWRRLLYTEPPASDDQLVRELRLRFKPEVQALSDYLGRDLVALWGYDEPSP